MKMKRGQVWVETLIYTSIFLVVMAAVLAFALPKIQKMQEQAVIEQSIDLLAHIDNEISNMGGSGNVRTVPFKLSEGKINIYSRFSDSTPNFIEYILEDASLEFSETDSKGDPIPARQGKIEILTTKTGKGYDVVARINYTEIYNFTIEGGSGKLLSIKSGANQNNLLMRKKTGNLIEFESIN